MSSENLNEQEAQNVSQSQPASPNGIPYGDPGSVAFTNKGYPFVIPGGSNPNKHAIYYQPQNEQKIQKITMDDDAGYNNEQDQNVGISPNGIPYGDPESLAYNHQGVEFIIPATPAPVSSEQKTQNVSQSSQPATYGGAYTLGGATEGEAQQAVSNTSAGGSI